jgi:hypothetical protein
MTNRTTPGGTLAARVRSVERRAYRELQDPADRDGKRDPKSKRRARQLRAKARVKP